MLASGEESAAQRTMVAGDAKNGVARTKEGAEGEADPWSVFAAGKTAFKAGQFEDAVDMFSRVLEHQ